MPNPMTSAYLFEAKGIQRYIFASGRLRDAVGASDLLARIASSNGDDLLAAVEAQGAPDLGFSRRGSGAFCAHFTVAHDAERFRDFWRLALSSALPGLEFADGIGQGVGIDTAIRSAYSAAGGVRGNVPAVVLPLGGPATAFAPRTGRPAVPTRNDEHGPVDMILAPVRRRSEAIPKNRVLRDAEGACAAPSYDALAERVLPIRFLETPSRPGDGHPLLLPRNLTEDALDEDTFHNPLFGFVGDVNRLALVHADLSGLGQYMQDQCGGKAASERLRLSKTVEAAVLNSVRKALGLIIDQGAFEPATYAAGGRRRRSNPHTGSPGRGEMDVVRVRTAAFRPIVAGGDDVTFLVRSDHALDFAAALLTGIEDAGLGLSACAGIALVKATTPFLLAHDLAEQLCKFAKVAAKRQLARAPFPSAVAFHSPMSSLGESYERVVLTGELRAGGVQLTAGPYGVGREAQGVGVAPNLTALFALVDSLGQLKGRGALRTLRTNLLDGRAAADTNWRRWRDVQQERAGRGGASLDSLDRALRDCGVQEPEASFIDPAARTPLFDALTILNLKPQTAADAAVGLPALETAP